MDDSTYYLFVIDTDSYAGNFERELCGYITGHIGDCGVGDKEALMFREEEDERTFDPDKKYFSYIAQVADDKGFLRPCMTWPNPAWFNNGLGKHYRRDDPQAEKESLEAYIKTAINDAEKYIKQVESNRNLSEEKRLRLGWTEEAIQREVKRQQDDIKKAKAETKIIKFNAFLSVAIVFDKKPTKNMIEVMKRRSYKYFKEVRPKQEWYKNKPVVNIEGFRLLKREVIIEEIDENL